MQMYTSLRPINDEDYLRDFIVHISCLDSIDQKTKSANFFDILGVSKAEIRHSFILSWLLNPLGNHGLGDAVLRAFLSKLIEAEPERYKANAFRLLLLNYGDFVVQREVIGIDILITSAQEKTIIVIENKINSREHKSSGYESQLNKYKDIVESYYPNYQKVFVYLTPHNESASDEDNWQSYSYDELVELLDDIYIARQESLSETARVIIKNYIDILRRDIVDNTELKRACEEIYLKYSKALDLIYQNSDMGMTPLQRSIIKVLNELKNNNIVDFDKNYKSVYKNRIVFHTPAMNSFLPALNEEKSSWGSKYVYNYWFSLNEDDEEITFIFELGLQGVNDDTKEKMKSLNEILLPSSKRDAAKFKRVKTFPKIKLKEKNDEERYSAIKEIINKVLKEEKTWIETCQKLLSNN